MKQVMHQIENLSLSEIEQEITSLFKAPNIPVESEIELIHLQQILQNNGYKERYIHRTIQSYGEKYF